MVRNEIVRSKRLFWLAFAMLLLAALACNAPGFEDDPAIRVPEGEHVSDEELRAEMDATYEAYFSDFDGEQYYSGNTIASEWIKPECDFGFPQGQNLQFDQAFTPGDEPVPYPRDQVSVSVDGFMQTYTQDGDSPYTFCRDVKKETGDNGKEILYKECLTFKHGGGFEVSVHRIEDPQNNYSWWDQNDLCYLDVFAPVPAPPQAEGEFDGSWNSGPVCSESETPFSWQVSLIQNGDSVIGSVHFHKCPGGGQVGYSVTGTVVPGQEYIELQGTKAGGAGALHGSSPETQVFTFFPDSPPLPNFGE
ncbi:MAG: hypothetical protein JW862_18775 [Anaerolineales bacterium]|nr:hypothetical protein [Anaerolineales bacterium]